MIFFEKFLKFSFGHLGIKNLLFMYTLDGGLTQTLFYHKVNYFDENLSNLKYEVNNLQHFKSYKFWIGYENEVENREYVVQNFEVLTCFSQPSIPSDIVKTSFPNGSLLVEWNEPKQVKKMQFCSLLLFILLVIQSYDNNRKADLKICTNYIFRILTIIKSKFNWKNIIKYSCFLPIMLNL